MSFKQKFRQIKKFPTWLYAFPAWFLLIFLHLIYRIHFHDPNGYGRSAEGKVGVMWHNRLLLFAFVFPLHMRRRTVGVISASRDGQYIADFISVLGVGSLRGSSSRGGTKVQLEAVNTVKSGKNVCYTPDGPRGPRYQMKAGPVHLAGMAHTCVVPISINARRYWELKSWDRFQIPKPFTRIDVVMGDGVYVPEKLSSAELESWRLKVEEALLKITVDRPAKVR